MSGFSSRLGWLLSPWTILASMALGVLLGVYLPDLALTLGPLGDLYLSLLQMCVLPVMITALVSSLARLLRTPGTARLVGRIVIVYLGGMLVMAVLSLGTGLTLRPGAQLSGESRQVLGQFLASSEQVEIKADMVISSGQSAPEPHPAMDFLHRMIPTNIFAALAQGEIMKILFFSLLMGVAVAMVPGRSSDRLVNDSEVVFESFVKIIQWLMYQLPLALPFLVAKQTLNLTGEMLGALFMYILVMHVVGLIGIVGSGVILRMRGGGTVLGSFKRCREPLILALSTASSFAAMPSAIKSLTRDYRFDPTAVSLLLPMGITMFRFGNVMYFSISTIFFFQLYGMPLTFPNLMLLLFLPVMTAVASAGAHGLVAVAMISLCLTPLGLPSDAATVLMLAAIPLVDPILTTATVHLNLAAAAMTAERASEGASEGVDGSLIEDTEEAPGLETARA